MNVMGLITIHVGGIPLGLSTGVGALLAGLACGYLRSRYRTFGGIPAPQAAQSTLPAVGYTPPFALGRIICAVNGIFILLLTK